MQKKLLSFVCLLILTLSLSACNAPVAPESESENTEATTDADSAASTENPETTEESGY